MATANDTAPRGEVVAFPGRRVRPLNEDQLPAHWSRGLRAHYLHVTYDGFNTHDQAFRYCEAMAAVEPQKVGESARDYSLRQARAAIALLPRRGGMVD